MAWVEGPTAAALTAYFRKRNDWTHKMVRFYGTSVNNHRPNGLKSLLFVRESVLWFCDPPAQG